MTRQKFAADVSSLADLAIDARRRADLASPPTDLPDHLRQWWDEAVNAVSGAESALKRVYAEMREFS